MYDIMTPGPTQVRENVRQARALACTNPDLDADFYDFYKETCEEISELLHTKNETLILDGEGILGLEAACATLTERGDRVLVMDNGEYGKGFAGFVTMYGGEPVLYSTDYRNAFDVAELEKYLEKDHDFKYAALVHCDTPSGMLNDVSKLCPLLKKYGILTLVDSVSAMFGEEMRVDDYQIDLLCGGSQKAVSAPPGLSFVTISADAYKAMHSRKTPVASFYANILAFDGYYEKKWFPYTMPISDIYGLRQAFDNIKNDPYMLERHAKIGNAVRAAVKEAGLELYQETGFQHCDGIQCPGRDHGHRDPHRDEGKMQHHAGRILRRVCGESDPHRAYGRKRLSGESGSRDGRSGSGIQRSGNHAEVQPERGV